MRTFLSFILSISIACVLHAQSTQEPEYHPHRILVKFHKDSPLLIPAREIAPRGPAGMVPVKIAADHRHAFGAVLTQAGIASLRALKGDATLAPLPGGLERIFIFETGDHIVLAEAMQQLERSGHFEYVERDYIGYGGGVLCAEEEVPPMLLPNDPAFFNQWGLRNTGQSIGGFVGTPGGDINIVPAWDITTGTHDILLAVLDSGVPASVPDFGTRMLNGYDYVNNDAIPNDDHGHGTNVTSIATATGNNGIAMAGVNWNCNIIHFKILNSQNSGQYSWWAAALYAAADSGAHVINMSVGGSGPSFTLHSAVQYAAAQGAIIVACMMNTNNQIPYHPAAYPEVIAIGATNNRNARAVPFCFSATSGSNFGNHIDFVAPGERITGLSSTNPSQTSAWCGTSQATPLVAGVISLMLGIKPDLTFQEIYDILKLTARDRIGPLHEDVTGWDRYFGWGMIDAHAALLEVDMLSSVADSDHQQSAAGLYNRPNPLSTSTQIGFTMDSGAHVSLIVYDAFGRVVSELISDVLPAGIHHVDWNAEVMPSGLYVVRLQTGAGMQTQKMLVQR